MVTARLRPEAPAAKGPHAMRCPHCGGDVEPSAMMREEILAELGGAMREKEVAILQQERALAEREAALSLDVERRVAVEARRISDREAKGVEERLAREGAERLRLKDEELALARAKMDAAAAREAAYLRERRELEERERQAAVELEKKLTQETRRIRDEEARRATERAAQEREQQALREAEHRETIDGLKKNLAELQRRVQQGSQQAQGEAQESALRELLVSAFEGDALDDVAKGASGADLLQRVRAGDGRDCGVIAWESKRTKAWSDGWLPKLRDDQRAAGADCAVLVTQELPRDIKHFGLKDGVWVCGWPYAVALGAALRAGLIDLSLARRNAEGRGEKMLMLYSYMTGTEFRNRIGGLVEAFKEMEDDLEQEKVGMQRLWKKREKQMQRARDNITAFYGDLQGIAGRQLKDLPSLGLEARKPARAALEPARAVVEPRGALELPFD